MRDVVRDAFVPLTVSFEGGYITFMFPDVKGLVSTGFGLLLDPVGLALGLPWRRSDGSLATREEIVADWTRVKNHPDAPRLGHKSVEHVAQLRLDKDGLYQAFQGKMNHNEAVLRSGFSEWDDWSADAQLGVMSMAWAVGPAFWDPRAGRNHWPKLTAALRARDFNTAAIECFLAEEKTISGLRPRNRANRILFMNAAISERDGLAPDALHYPHSLADAEPTHPGFEYRAEPDFAIVHPAVPHAYIVIDDIPVDVEDEPPS